LRLSALFGIDALSSGFIAQSLVVLWFFERFGAGAAVLGPVFSVGRLIQAISYPIAMRLADRFGLLRTMVFTHLPSQFLLLGLAAAPTLPIAISLLLIRQGLSNMDIPIRQAYLTSIVPPDERVAAAGVTNLTRNVTESVSPSITGAAFQSLAYSLPIVLSAISGIIYDLALYASFRHVRLASDDLVLTE
jgi:MFS family permease